MKGLKFEGDVKYLANDGVLRSLNPAHDTVVDYVQLNKGQIAEFFALLDRDVSFMSDADGRAVTSEAQLWAIPNGIFARSLNANTSENVKVSASLTNSQPACVTGSICNEKDDCAVYNYIECI